MYIYIKAVTFVVKRGKMAPNKLLRCKNVGAFLCLGLQKRQTLPMEKYFMPEQNCFSSAKQFILTP
jgi:hypothetical protein